MKNPQRKSYVAAAISSMVNNTDPAAEQEVLKTSSYKPALADTQVLAYMSDSKQIKEG